MKKRVIILIGLVFVVGTILCGDVFAQRDVNVAQEAAEKARASIREQSDDETVEIENSGPVNTSEPSSNSVTIGQDGSIKIGYEGKQQNKQP